jgi:hypothetical protein
MKQAKMDDSKRPPTNNIDSDHGRKNTNKKLNTNTMTQGKMDDNKRPPTNNIDSDHGRENTNKKLKSAKKVKIEERNKAKKVKTRMEYLNLWNYYKIYGNS